MKIITIKSKTRQWKCNLKGVLFMFKNMNILLIVTSLILVVFVGIISVSATNLSKEDLNEAQLVEPDPKKVLERKIFIGKSVLEDMKVGLDKNNSEHAKELERINKKLEILIKLQNDLKENKKSITELELEYDKIRKIKINLKGIIDEGNKDLDQRKKLKYGM